MSSRPRRSRRAPKKFTDYAPGDVIELTRNGVAVRARLAQLLTEAASPNPRWLIKFESPTLKDEEVYEHTFKKTLVSASSSPTSKRGSGSDSNNEDSQSVTLSAPPSPDPHEDLQESSNAANKHGTNTASSNANSSNEDDEEGSTSFPSGTDEMHVLSGATTKEQQHAARVSAREARSRRRQAKMLQEAKLSKNRGFRGGLARSGNAKRAREEGEECIKVPFLTGTLYLYRGPKKRRAEFVRRV